MVAKNTVTENLRDTLDLSTVGQLSAHNSIFGNSGTTALAAGTDTGVTYYVNRVAANSPVSVSPR